MIRDNRTDIRTLYLSDESVAGDEFREALERQPFVSIVVAEGIEDGIGSVSEDIDCVVSTHDDDIDGVAFLEAIRERDPDLPFVLLADDEDGMEVSRAVAANVSGYVPRKAEEAPRILIERIEAVAERSSRFRADGISQMPIDELGMSDVLWLKERAMEEAPVGITISDPDRPDNPLIYLNDAFEELTGYPPDETVGRNCRFLQGEESDPEAIAAIREAIDREEPVSVELVNYRKDGEKFWNKVDIAPVRDDGAVTNYVGFQTDVTKRKEAELEVRRERQNLDHLLTRVNGLIQDVTRELVQAVSRGGIERTICERIAAADTYEFAWVGEPDLSRDAITANAWAGAWEPASEQLEIALSGDTQGLLPTGRAHETSETQLVEDFERLATIAEATPWIEADDLRGIAAIPLAYHETRYGVLTVYTTQESALDEREIVVLEALARATATAINALERGRILVADTVIDIEFEIRDQDLFFVDISAREDCVIEYNGSIYRSDGSALLFFTSDAAPSAVESIVEEHPEIEAVTLINEHDDGNLFEFTVAETSIITTLAERGAKTRSMTAAEGAGRLSVELPKEMDARAIVDLLEERYHGTELVSYRERERPPETKQEFITDLEDRLTERQLMALQTAYVSGFYEWKRPVSGDKLAETMDIARSTFHQHLRAAERKLIAEFFDR